MVTRYFLLLLAFVAGPASAQTLAEAMFPKDDSCYLRVYSQDHLARHPAQRVQQIAIGPYPDDPQPGALTLGLALVLRDGGAVYEGTAYCTAAEGGLDCGVEGDGGGFRLTAQGGDLRLAVGDAGIGLEGAADFVALSGTDGDDREFLLRPAKCP